MKNSILTSKKTLPVSQLAQVFGGSVGGGGGGEPEEKKPATADSNVQIEIEKVIHRERVLRPS